jgi:hypothetical protein
MTSMKLDVDQWDSLEPLAWKLTPSDLVANLERWPSSTTLRNVTTHRFRIADRARRRVTEHLWQFIASGDSDLSAAMSLGHLNELREYRELYEALHSSMPVLTAVRASLHSAGLYLDRGDEVDSPRLGRGDVLTTEATGVSVIRFRGQAVNSRMKPYLLRWYCPHLQASAIRNLRSGEDTGS